MTAKKAHHKPKGDPFLEELDKFAKELMKEAVSVKVEVKDEVETSAPAYPLPMRLEVFRQMVSWQGVRNKLKEGPEDTALDDIRASIQRARSVDTRTASGRTRPRSARGSSLGPQSDYLPSPGNGTSALDAIKDAAGRLSRADAGDDDGDGDGAEC